jgi:hypothetical protein
LPEAEGQDRHVGLAPAQLDRRADALVGLGRRHPNIDDREVRLELRGRREQAVGIADAGDDLVALVLQQRGDPASATT